MHPIERLRYVARAEGAGPAALVRAAAGALAGFCEDQAALVTACRRLVERHWSVGPVWWLSARVLSAPDPAREAWAVAEEAEADPTPAVVGSLLPPEATTVVLGWSEQVASALAPRGDLQVLAVDALGGGEELCRHLARAGAQAEDVPESGLGLAVAGADLVLLEAAAAGPEEFVATAGSAAAAALGRARGVPVWVVAGAGRVLPSRLWEALVARSRARAGPAWDQGEELVPLAWADRVVGPSGPCAPSELARRADCPVAPELLRPPGG